MASKAKVIKMAVDQALKANGFLGLNGSYLKRLDEVVWVVSLVKERGKLWGLGCGVWVLNLPTNESWLASNGRTEDSICHANTHVRISLNDFSTSEGSLALDCLFDTGSDISDEVRVDRIRYEIDTFLIPVFSQLSTAVDCCKNVARLSYARSPAHGLYYYCEALKEGRDIRLPRSS